MTFLGNFFHDCVSTFQDSFFLFFYHATRANIASTFQFRRVDILHATMKCRLFTVTCVYNVLIEGYVPRGSGRVTNTPPHVYRILFIFSIREKIINNLSAKLYFTFVFGNAVYVSFGPCWRLILCVLRRTKRQRHSCWTTFITSWKINTTGDENRVL